MQSLSIEVWAEIFKHFRQVDRVEFSSDRLQIYITGGKTTIEATTQEMNKRLFMMNNDPCAVAASLVKESPPIDNYQDTLLGYYDIIAYSEYLKEKGTEEVKKKMCEFMKAVKSLIADMGNLKIDVSIMSDSMILVLDTNRSSLNIETVKWFLTTCHSLMGIAMTMYHVPLRGAIGGGDFWKSGEVIVSTALVDAVRYEKEQEWLGAVLTPKAVEVMRKANIDLSSSDFNDFIGFGEIPWKNDRNSEWYYIKPILKTDSDWVQKYLPPHFDIVRGSKKIANSHCLYG